MALQQSPEKGHSAHSAPEQGHRTLQPGKTAELSTLLEGIDTGTMQERAGESAGEQWSQSGGVVATSTQGQAAQLSPRDQAIRNLPSPKVMQRQIGKHITKEVRNLRREARSIIRLGKPGEAYKLANIYARIRNLQSLLAQLWDASYDVVKRLFIRIFIDKQTVL